jgi:hypothetical protein
MLIYKTCPACAGEPLMNKIFEGDTCGNQFCQLCGQGRQAGYSYPEDVLHRSAIQVGVINSSHEVSF